MPHHHIYFVSTVCFLLANALHALVNINDLAQKNKATLGATLKIHWIPILVRAAFAMFVFLAFLEGQLIDVLTAIHIPVPQGVAGLNLNSGPIAALCGYCADSALGYVPKLNKIGLPPAIDVPANGSAPPPTAKAA